MAYLDENEYEEWSNELAQLIPEEYEDDIAQEAIIENFIKDAAKVFEELGYPIWQQFVSRNIMKQMDD